MATSTSASDNLPRLRKLVKKLGKSSGQRLEHVISSLKKQLPEGGQILADNR